MGMNRVGFSLIEIMIVVVIIGILATMAYPSLEKYLQRSKQTEAKTNLTAIYTAQKLYFAENQKYASNTAALPIELQTSGMLYTYTISVQSSSFTATATGNLDDDNTKDIWTINQNKSLQNTTDDTAD